MTVEFNKQDLAALKKRGIDPDEAQRQLRLLRGKAPFRNLTAACTPQRGVRVLSEGEVDAMAKLGVQASAAGRVSRFVPASGAASRMFKALIPWSKKEGVTLEQVAGDKAVAEFFFHLDDFAFAPSLAKVLGCKGSLKELAAGGNLEKILNALLSDEGLGYAQNPKALIEFHRVDGRARTALEEQMAEAAKAVASDGGACVLNLTVSPEHRKGFEAVAGGFGVEGTVFDLRYSEQEPSTDTLALDEKGEPFRTAEGELLFRPGGHGALLGNLAGTGADLLQVKNIDNIAAAHLREVNVRWMSALSGIAASLQEQAQALSRRLSHQAEDEEAVAQARDLLRGEFFVMDPPQDAASLLAWLERPLRVCGVVKNQGEPGGGPFWVKDAKGRVSAQIVETAEINLKDAGQRSILDSATHFNPVLMVAALRDRHGKAYDLTQFRDDDAVFIAEKSQEGKPLKALERPGLWNGSMAGWLTLFVEVPLETFNPVKTVNDLLRAAHQG